MKGLAAIPLAEMVRLTPKIAGMNEFLACAQTVATKPQVAWFTTGLIALQDQGVMQRVPELNPAICVVAAGPVPLLP